MANDPAEPCCRCGAAGAAWDRLGGFAVCLDCMERFARGDGEPLTVPLEQDRHCGVCGTRGCVRFGTVPREWTKHLAIALCPEHLRALIGRRLTAKEFVRAERHLQSRWIDVRQVYLLSEAFYDDKGRAKCPVDWG